jgi:hypothetical protein
VASAKSEIVILLVFFQGWRQNPKFHI